MADKAPRVSDMEPPPPPMAVSEDLLSDVTVVSGLDVSIKRKKGKRATESRDESVMSTGDSEGAQEMAARKAKRVRKAKVAVTAADAVNDGEKGDRVSEFKAISAEFIGFLVREGLSAAAVEGAVNRISKYEEVLIRMMLESERLTTKLEIYGKAGAAFNAPSVTKGMGAVQASAVQVSAVQAPLKPAPKPTETWSVVVRSKDAASKPEEVVRQVVTNVGPALGVRVHTVKPAKGKGAVIRTPSLAERDKIVKNKRFEEVGLVATVGEGIRPKVVVSGVDSEFSPEDFMGDLFAKNLKGVMSRETFDRDVKLASKPWTVGPGKPVNVVIEGSELAIRTLLRIGRVYVKWYSFHVREYSRIPVCFKCLAPGHYRRECRMEKSVCRRCGEQGHTVANCMNNVSCRNCIFKGRPSGHLMNSAACPIYCDLVARMEARH